MSIEGANLELAAVLDAGSLIGRDVRSIDGGRHSMWLVEGADERLVLHKYPKERGWDEIAWEHRLLERMASARAFPVARPVKAFAGASMLAGTTTWGLLTWLPGSSAGWNDSVPLELIGEFVASFHASLGRLNVGPRPVPVPALGELRSAVSWKHVESCLGREGARLYRLLLDETLSDIERLQSGVQVLGHGDLHVGNILVEGCPSRCCGLIDFAMAHQLEPVTELAFGLWRSGRRAFDDPTLDVERVRRIVRGYHLCSPLVPETADALPVHLVARGLQLIARWSTRRPQDHTKTLERTLAVRDARGPLRDATERAIRQ